MTSSMLEKCSEAFRRGYNDANRDRDMPADLPGPGTFYGHDYREGFGAAKNEIWWDAVRREVRSGLLRTVGGSNGA